MQIGGHCRKRTVERGPTACRLVGVLPACAQHGIEGVLRVTEPLSVLDEVQGTRHYRRGRTELPAAYRLRETPRGYSLIKVSEAEV